MLLGYHSTSILIIKNLDFQFKFSGITSTSSEIFATGGRHLGRDKTLEKINARFYYRLNMADEVKDFVSKCERYKCTTSLNTIHSVLHFHMHFQYQVSVVLKESFQTKIRNLSIVLILNAATT